MQVKKDTPGYLEIYDVDDLVRRELDGRDYDLGQMEATRATADNCAEMLSKLVNLLMDRGILKTSDLGKLGIWGDFEPVTGVGGE